jgi:ATP-binding cassette subfamily B protein
MKTSSNIIGQYLKPHLLAVSAVICLVLARAMTELSLPRLMSVIVDRGIALGDTALILRVGLAMLGINLAGMAFAFGSSMLSSRVAASAGAAIRLDVFSKISAFSPVDMDHFGVSSLMTRVTNDVSQVQNVILMSMRIMLMAPLMMVGGIVMAITQDRQLSVLLLFALPVLALVIFLFARKGMPLFKSIQERTDGLNRVVRENLAGLRVIRAFNKRRHEESRFSGAARDLADTTIRVSQLMALLMPLIMLLLNGTIILVLWSGAIRIGDGDLKVGSLMAFIQYVGQILNSLVMVSMLFVMIPRAAVSVRRLDDVLSTTSTVLDPVRLLPLPAERRLVFDRVCFRYEGAEKTALDDLSFSCEPGLMTAVIGGTGSGKSTILNLLMRFRDPESGLISMGGIDIRALPRAGLRSVIGYVPQKSFLFSGTIRDNLSYGNVSASESELWAALEAAQLASFVGGLPDGLETMVSRGGTTLSGGQRQRLAIARALVRQPGIYLFDDSFSALDAATDRALRQSLAERTTNAVVILVTQRIASARNADQIIVLEEGRLAGMGSHAELVAGCTIYREILGSQLGEEAAHVSA